MNFNSLIHWKTLRALASLQKADVARLFDPLGLINPVIVLGKIFLQRLWIARVYWDEEITDNLKVKWIKYRSQLWELSKVRIPRYVFATDLVRCEVHGFPDASLKAFGCCIYVRVENSLGNVSVNLLSAKSKVAPVSTQSLPRLELCAALLLSKLLQRVLDVFDMKFDEIFLWKHSEIVLDCRAVEYEDALLRAIFVVQQSSFKNDFDNLQSGNMCVYPKSRIRKLYPYLQLDSLVPLIRVGGRLELSELPYGAKHPILLPKSHPLVEGFMDYLHVKHHHAGAQALTSISRQRLWIIDARSLAKKILHRCLRCFRMRSKLREQIMGDLPSSRVCSTRPFLVSGVDFCGPFSTRGCRTTKSYMAVFVCFSTKAVHLEIVSDLTTNGFMAALRRFIARRGICPHLYCDNGTNFVGARNEMADLKKQFYSQNTESSILKLCAEDSIEFHHIPLRSSHFGGLWESAVKSANCLLIRSCSNSSFTFEELTSVTAEIESILNSRPMTPLSSDPSDEQVLTPGHFIICSPLTSFEEPDITNISRL